MFIPQPRPRGRWRDDRGQAVVEFALIAPILLILMLGLVEFGRAWNAYQVITDAAREGARVAAVGPYDISTYNAARAATINALFRVGLAEGCSGGSCVEVIPNGGGSWDTDGPPVTGGPVTVRITYPYSFVFLRPFLRWTTGEATVNLKTSVVMRKE